MSYSKSTDCIHSETKFQGVNTPIFTSTANRYRGYEEVVYPRYYNNDNQKIIVEKLARLEKGETGMAFSSGMAAISTALLSHLRTGDHVVVSSEIYGGTFKFISEEFPKYGISYDFVPGNDPAEFESKIQASTKVIYTETPSNPLLSIIDLKMVAQIAKKHGLITMIDNTFASPINQNPIGLGVDVVIHSGTKYLGGHSDLCFGAVICQESFKQKMLQTALNLGGSLNAMDCYLIDRSLKTLAVRVEKQNANAMRLAEYLQGHPQVKQVYYPGLTSHPGHEIAKSQMKGGFGGMLSFELKDGARAGKFLDALELIAPAVSLGGVETIICQPSQTSHAKMPKAERLKIGVTDELIRLSVGIEDVNDLARDLEKALS